MKTTPVALALLAGLFSFAPAIASADDAPAIDVLTPTAGPSSGGAVVVLFGSDLSPDQTVWFGGAPATHVEAVGDGMLEVEAPAGTGTVDVCVGGRVIAAAYHYDAGDASVVTPCFPVETTLARIP